MKVLYWNVHKKPIQHLVAALAHEHEVDVIILSECKFSPTEFLIELNTPITQKYGLPFSPVLDPVIVTRFLRNSISIVRDLPGVCFRRLFPPIGSDLLLVTVHLQSKLYNDKEEQALYCTRLARYIQEEETKIGHRRTLVVGDFNMNPFESGMVGAEGLHSVMTRRIAARQSRKVKGEERFFFYNPMWNHFGEFPVPPAGTYFYDSASQINYYWNMFDQVLIRPDLLHYFHDETLQIITSVGSTNFINSDGKPDTQAASDHLPIMFQLELHKGVEI